MSREKKIDRIRSVLDSKEFRDIGKRNGYPHNYCTFTPMYRRDFGFLAYHWYENFKWDAKCTFSTIDYLHMITTNAQTMWDGVMFLFEGRKDEVHNGHTDSNTSSSGTG